ncbi:MAG: conjugal transfer protein TraF, partial [Elusimicrobia bacterium]|nr:conjugal transfer protein TraF [Elusimicrobiota bacterium]
LLSADAPIGFQWSNFAISFNTFASVGLTPVIDTQNIGFNVGGTGLQLDNLGAAADTASVAIIEGALTGDVLTGMQNILGTTLNANEIANALVLAAENQGISNIGFYAQQIANGLAGAEGLIAILGGAGSFDDNQTAVIADAAMFNEVAFGYGHQVNNWLRAGANVRLIRGQIARAGYRIFDENNDIGDIISDSFDGSKVSWRPALDLGVQIDINELIPVANLPFSPRFGLAARNINNPSFDRPYNADFPTDSSHTLRGQYRAGLAINPRNFWTIALDYDIIRNNTVLKNYYSQMLALGTEVGLLNSRLPLRGGVMKNTAENSDYTLTAGFGINLRHVHFDFAGAFSTGTVTVDGTSVPSQFGGAFSLAVLF